MIFGPGGIFGDAKLMIHDTVERPDGTTAMVPMSEEDAAQAMAQHHAKDDAANESMAMRIDQYALNFERSRHLCEAKGDLQDIAAMIKDGLPPQVRSDLSSS
jgi:hypothetical protein